MTRGRQRKKLRQQAIALAKKEAAAPHARKDSGVGNGPEDIPLVGQAVRGGWGVNESVRLHVAQKMVKHASSDDPHVATKAARVLLEMNDQQERYLSQTAEITDDGPKPSEVIPEVLNHGDILAALRSAALASDSVPSPVCAPREPRSVEARPPSSDA